MWILLSGLAAAATVSVDGECPGRFSLTVEGATPGGRVLFVFAPDTADASVPVGRCRGEPMGLDPAEAEVRRSVVAGPAGGVGVRFTTGPEECGTFTVAFDVESCAASDPARLGEPLVLHRTLWDDLGDGEAVEVPGDHTVVTATRDASPALLRLSRLNGLGVVGGRSDTDVDDGETVRVDFEGDAWLVSVTHVVASDLDGDGVLGGVRVEAELPDGSRVGPVSGSVNDLVDASGWLGVEAVRALTITAVGDSFRLAGVGHLEAP